MQSLLKCVKLGCGGKPKMYPEWASQKRDRQGNPPWELMTGFDLHEALGLDTPFHKCSVSSSFSKASSYKPVVWVLADATVRGAGVEKYSRPSDRSDLKILQCLAAVVAVVRRHRSRGRVFRSEPSHELELENGQRQHECDQGEATQCSVWSVQSSVSGSIYVWERGQ